MYYVICEGAPHHLHPLLKILDLPMKAAVGQKGGPCVKVFSLFLREEQ